MYKRQRHLNKQGAHEDKTRPAVRVIHWKRNLYKARTAATRVLKCCKEDTEAGETGREQIYIYYIFKNIVFMFV
jgi:hypothetical protein